MPKKIAILQSNYIPWRGYFDLIHQVDEFILFDTAQYTKNDWRNRNTIKTKNGLQWLTIPVKQEKLNQRIMDTKVADKTWKKKHWKSIQQNYSKAQYFNLYKDIFEKLYLDTKTEYISEINFHFIETINKLLGIDTKIKWSSEFDLIDGQTEKLLDICKQCGADTYLSGPAAKSYFDLELAKNENITVEWMDYKGYLPYKQLFEPYESNVSILDLLFNIGDASLEYITRKENDSI